MQKDGFKDGLNEENKIPEVEVIIEDADFEAEADDKTDDKSKKKKKKDKRQDEIDALTAQRDENYDKYLRAAAEFDNFRKRTAREKAAMYDDGAKDAIFKILPVLDSFQRAMASAPADDQMCKGFMMILKQLQDSLTAIGVQEIEALGKTFDPNLHDGVMHVDDEAFGPSEIVEVLMTGYMYKDKVLRYSMVKVAN